MCLDDMLMFSNNNKEDHVDKISIVMKRLQDHNLKVKVSKCKFLQKKASCIGYEITNTGLCPQKNKIEAMLQMAPPKTRKLVRGFVGMFNYYRRLHPTSKINM